jgi:hypothetical protein
MKALYKSHRILLIGIALAAAVFPGCKKDFFDKQPLDAVSDATFWQSENDAMLALVGVYGTGGAGWRGEDFWTPRGILWLDLMAGQGSEKELIPDRVTDGSLNSTYWLTQSYWSNSYQMIASCNNFLGHIDAIQMDNTKKLMMIAEVRTLRAYHYFNLALYFGDVPLITTLLNPEEANKVSREPRATVWGFCEKELKESSAALPKTRSANENGRVTSGASLAILGRVEMAQKKWVDAAAAYKTIIDNNVYQIDPEYRQLFWEAGELSKEIVLASQYQQDKFSHVLLQYLYPETWGGWHQFSPFNELVNEFECKDGRTIQQSPLYNKDRPYENRDPRLDYTIMISDRTTYKGQTFRSHPDSASSPDRMNKYPVWSGYSINKYMDPNFSASMNNYGGNWNIVRYAEVLLSYLEAVLESGGAVDQGLLDATINKVRGRQSVNMPPVTTLNPAELRTVIRRERQAEFAFEGLRYFDILRWGIASAELNKQFTGMKLTTDPAGYTRFPVDANGYYKVQKRNFKTGVNELWPIPQSERDINPNLTQNPGY